MPGEDSQVNVTYNWVILNRVLKMNDAEARGDKDSYFIYFRLLARLVKHWMRNEDQLILELNYKALEEAIARIKKEDINEASRSQRIIDLKNLFADKHSGMVLSAFANSNLFRIQEEGVLDFEQHDFDEVSEIIRSRGAKGMEKAVKDATGKTASKVRLSEQIEKTGGPLA